MLPNRVADAANHHRSISPVHVPTPQAVALTIEQVVERLLETTGGQIVACNILAGVQNGLVDVAWAAKVLALMGKVGGVADYDDPTQFLGLLDVLRTRPSTASPSDLPDIRLGSADAPAPFEVEVSSVLPAWILGKQIFRDDRRRLRRAGLTLPRSATHVLSADVVNEWRNAPAQVRTVRAHPAAEFGRREDVIWFTRRSALKEALAAVPTNLHAQRTRDLLGLVHHQEGAMLAAMHFQPPTLSACPSARPTFADAGAGRTRFKAWPDGESARRDRSWGRTVDLPALNAHAPSVDGCPERIAKSTKGDSLASGATFEFELLGAVQTTADQGDVEFARRLSKGRSTAELGTELNALISAHTGD